MGMASAMMLSIIFPLMLNSPRCTILEVTVCSLREINQYMLDHGKSQVQLSPTWEEWDTSEGQYKS